MADGPTTTGSIDAKLTIDKSAWDRSVAEAKAEARELGALSPEVKIDANVGPALAKMAEVEAVERQLEATNVRLAATEKIVDREQVQSTSSAMRLATVEKLLGEAHKETAAKAAEQAVAEQANTQATDKGVAASDRAGAANNRRVSGLQVLLGLSPAILAAAAPIAAGAVGLGVAFGVMGVSGVLAIKGIKDEMAAGSTAGNEYAAGLGVLKGSLDQLSATSANAMLGSFNGAVGDINARMPFLNQLVGEGSSLLGAMGGTALSGVLNGLEKMNPLIQTGGVELGKFVTWLFSFTNTNGFSEFIAYAQANLPATMTLIESLVTTAGHIVAAFAPLGPVVIGVLTGISDVASALPLPVLAGLVTTATLIGPAMTIAGAGMKIAGDEAAIFGMKANLAVPVVGILLAALSGLGLMAITAAQGTDHGSASMQNYTQALRDDTNAIGEHVRAQAAKALADSGAVSAARTLGVSIDDVTAAATGNADALARVNSVTHDAINASQGAVAGHQIATEAQVKNGAAAKVLAAAVDGTNGAITDGIQKNKDYAEILAATKASTEANTGAAQLNANTYGTSVSMYQQAVTAQDKAKQSTDAQTLAMQLQGDAAGLLKQAFDALNGKSLSLEQAQTRSAGATNSVTQAFQQNGLAIDGGTAAAVANQTALQNKAATDQATAEAVAKATGKTEEGTAAYAASKAQLEKTMAAQGLLTDDVQGYIDKLYDVNNFKPKPVTLDVNTADAQLKVAGFQRAVDSLTGKTVLIYAQANIDAAMAALDTLHANSMVAANAYATGAAYSTKAAGGMVAELHADGGVAGASYLARGGFPGGPSGTDTVPTWLTPGEVVIKRASVDSIGAGNLLEANRTGRLPSQGLQGGPVTVNLILDGQIIDTRIVDLTNQTIDGVARQIGGMRK